MPNKAAIVRTFEINAERATYTNKFATLIEKLRALGLADEHILDLYIEVLKSKKGNKITEFTNLIWGTDSSVMAIPEAIKCFKEIIMMCRGIGPLDFIMQYTAFVKADIYDTNLENGVVGEEFLRMTGSEDNNLIVDPHPAFIMKCLAQKKMKVTFTFTDDRYVQILQYSKEKDSIVSFSNLEEWKFDRILYFARNTEPKGIKNIMDDIRSSLIPRKQATTYLFLPTAYMEKKKEAAWFWDYLTDRFTINKIILFSRDSVTAKPFKKSLIVLNNAPAKKNEEILVQKTKRTGKQTVSFLEFRRIKFERVNNSGRTLSELYDTDYIDYAAPMSRKRAEAYQFTAEFAIYVSVTEDKKRGFRPQYSIYDYPTVAQERKNVLPRGELIWRKRGNWYPTREEAVASAESILLNDKDLAKKVREIMNERYHGEVISLKSHVFLHLDKLEKWKKYDDMFIKSLFFQPHSAQVPLCNLSVGMAAAEDVQKNVDAIVSEQKRSETKEKLLWETLNFLFTYAVVDERYKKNPISGLLNDRGQVQKNKKAVRRNMALPSFSEDQEHQFLQIVMSNLNSPIYIMMLVKFFTGLAVNLLRAMKVEDFVLNPELNIHQLAITKTCRAREQETYQLPKNKQRYFPLPEVIAEVIDENLQARNAKSVQRLFAFLKTPNQPISERQFWREYNKVMDQMDLSEFKISLSDGDNIPEQTDIDAYGGDLLRENFSFHAKDCALMNIGDVDTLLGTYPKDTGRRYYLAYKDPFVQLYLRTMLDRWVARLMLPDTAKCTVEETDEEYIIRGTPTKTKSELVIEADVDFDPNNYNINELILSLYAEYGATVSITFLEGK